MPHLRSRRDRALMDRLLRLIAGVLDNGHGTPQDEMDAALDIVNLLRREAPLVAETIGRHAGTLRATGILAPLDTPWPARPDDAPLYVFDTQGHLFR
jgi:hypothetical protein